MNGKISIVFANGTDRGLKRSENQDAFGKFPEGHSSLDAPKGQLFIIADGMGGHAAGRVASHMAVAVAREAYFNAPSHDMALCLKHAVETANARIFERAQNIPELDGMGTTCTLLALQGGHGCIAHVGDSRAYRITQAGITQLTSDHSKVAEMQRFGILTAEQASRHPEKSYLSRALGMEPEVETDIIPPFILQNGESYLLCTDGLGKIKDREIQKIILSRSPASACRKLIALANQRGGDDNVTVQVIHVTIR